MTLQRHEVLVVGGGLVGASAVLALQQTGIDAALIEARPQPDFDMQGEYALRVSAIAPAARQWLAQLGVWQQVEASGRAAAFSAMHVWEAAQGSGLTWRADELGVPALGWIVENDLLLHALWAALAQVPTYCPATPSAIELGAAAAQVTLADGRSLQAPLLVAADGANSALRRMAGIIAPRQDYGQQGIVANVRCASAHQHTAWQRFLPSGPLAFLPLADGRCSIVWSATAALARELLALDDADFAERLGDAFEQRLGVVTACGPRAAFPLQRLHAERYTATRFALLGDAAHVIHPLAGQGVNLGFADARALVQALLPGHRAGADLGAPAPLQRYERQRRADNALMLGTTDALSRLFARPGGSLGWLRREGMRLVDGIDPLKQRLARQALGL